MGKLTIFDSWYFKIRSNQDPLYKNPKRLYSFNNHSILSQFVNPYSINPRKVSMTITCLI